MKTIPIVLKCTFNKNNKLMLSSLYSESKNLYYYVLFHKIEIRFRLVYNLNIKGSVLCTKNRRDWYLPNICIECVTFKFIFKKKKLNISRLMISRRTRNKLDKCDFQLQYCYQLSWDNLDKDKFYALYNVLDVVRYETYKTRS